jgi:LCP family protein required for cell wall assembly
MKRRLPRAPERAVATTSAPAHRRVHPFRRHLFGCIVIVVATATAISVGAINVVSTVADDFALGGTPLDSQDLTPAQVGQPETILVIGDDHIGKTTTYANGAEQDVNGTHLLHADTFMLVRMDPAQDQTSILSIPRDLLVSFTWQGVPYTDQKFNTAYSVGRDDLVKKVVLATIPGITINHVIDFNFDAFTGLIDAIGCVYVDVDERYLNPPGDAYQPINIEPGYQRLCGAPALSYVRYRHTDSDFVRVARQQDFIRDAKEQLGVWGFLSKWSALAKAFGQAVWTDIRGAHEIADLLYLAAFSQAKPIREVPFNVSNADYQVTTPSGAIESAVLSTPQLIAASVRDFLYEAPKASLPGGGTSTASSGQAVTHSHTHHVSHHSTSVAPGTHDLYAIPASVTQQALAITPAVGVPIYLPSVQTGPASPNDFHPYTIRDEQGNRHYGYRIDWSAGSEGEYYGIEGMNWTNPPLFANPTGTETIGGRTYMFVDDGSAYHDIGWREGGVLYWVSNSLNETLSNAQMLAIAESAQQVH